MSTITPAQWRKRGKARGVHKPGEMNRTEAAYALILEAKKRTGEIAEYWFERVTFKLGKDVRYTPDFMVLEADLSVTFIEVKAATKTKYALKSTGMRKRIPRIEDDAKAKMPVASEQFPFVFKIVFPADGGGWEERYL